MNGIPATKHPGDSLLQRWGLEHTIIPVYALTSSGNLF